MKDRGGLGRHYQAAAILTHAVIQIEQKERYVIALDKQTESPPLGNRLARLWKRLVSCCGAWWNKKVLIRSDARHIPLADESVHCVVTSPPYWGLRSYEGNPGMIGLEATFDEHLENLVAVFREVRRVLRPDGTLWLNYGDAYAGGGAPTCSPGLRSQGGGRKEWTRNPAHRMSAGKPKDLMMMPSRVAMALQADGWWLRSEIVWHKPNPMPESVTDRPTSSHEKMFLLSKSAKYFYDAEAVREPGNEHHKNLKSEYRPISEKALDDDAPGGVQRANRGRPWKQPDGKANLRNVWKIATHSFKEAHFATFPPKLVEPCILAGTSEKGCCAECGAPWVRVVEKTAMEIRRSERTHEFGHTRSSGTMTKPPTCKTIGWSPSCSCDATTQPATVLDPFAGSGTVVRVATRFNRRGIGCDLGYHEIAKKRTSNVQRMLL